MRAISTVLAVMLLASPALVRVGHGGLHMHVGSGNDEAHRHADEAYLKSVADERDHLIGKLKSICRGC